MTTIGTVNVKHGPSRTPLSERFWGKVAVADEGSCWEWQAYRNRSGYGTIGAGGHGTGNLLAHRVAYELTYGVIPQKTAICHTCDNPPCCNPGHLFAGTQTDNMRDCAEKARTVRGERQKTARLTEELVPLVRRAAKTASMRAVARQFGVSPTVVRDVVIGRTWRWVP